MSRPADHEGICKIAEERLASAPIPLASESLKLEMITVSSLTVDERYQRRVSDGSRKRIKKIISEFSWARFGAIIVARNDGVLSVVDGQHRVIAARALGIESVPAVICEAGLLDQARDFVGINSLRTGVASIDKFRARIAAKDPLACKVAETLDALEISTDVPAGAALSIRQTRAVTVLERIAKHENQGLLYNTLELMLEAQPSNANLLTAFAIETVALALAKVSDCEASLDRLEAVVAETDFETLRENAAQLVKIQGGKSAWRGHELLLREFNRNLKKRVA